ncbi:MAG: radical SAM protein [Lachnospiraceae bacterium]|nr:radical SAM protein [Lachnospiraceae bacterium]
MKPLSIYLHIPFCRSKCAYCDFLSFVAADYAQIKEYVRVLTNEIAVKAPSFHEYTVTTVFIGGGTPSLLMAREIKAIIASLREHFNFADETITPAPEMTIEVNPDSVTPDILRCYRAIGINRLSIGLQSTTARELQLLGRTHSYDDFLLTYENARQAGFDNINIDLIAGLPQRQLSSEKKSISLNDTLPYQDDTLPYQDDTLPYHLESSLLQSWRQTLDEVAALKPEHISIYGLQIEAGTPFFARYGEGGTNAGELLTEEMDRRIYHFSTAHLSAYNYIRYEISNYARRGYECRHNLNYWRRGDYLGLGLGAASMIANVRWCNTRFQESYIMTYSKNDKKTRDLWNNECYVKVSSDAIRNGSGNGKTYLEVDRSIASENDKSIDKSKGRGKEELQVLSKAEQMEEFMFLGLRLTEGVNEAVFEDNFGIKIDDAYPGVLGKLSDEGLIVVAENISLTEKGIDVSNYVLAKFIF